MENNWVVYKHTNKINGKVYIGITSKKPNRRWKSGKGYMCNRYFWNAIQKYGWEEGFSHEILISGLLREEALAKEVELIAEYNSLAPNGYNQTIGGEGCNGWKMADYQKEKISKAHKGKKRPPHVGEAVRRASTGRIPSREARRRMSASQKGRHHTDETKQKLSEIMKAKGIPQEAVDAAAKIHKRPIEQYSLDGRLIAVWPSAMDAERSGQGFNHSAIAKCARGKVKQYKGFVWQYVQTEIMEVA